MLQTISEWSNEHHHIAGWPYQHSLSATCQRDGIRSRWNDYVGCEFHLCVRGDQYLEAHSTFNLVTEEL